MKHLIMFFFLVALPLSSQEIIPSTCADDTALTMSAVLPLDKQLVFWEAWTDPADSSSHACDMKLTVVFIVTTGSRYSSIGTYSSDADTWRHPSLAVGRSLEVKLYDPERVVSYAKATLGRKEQAFEHLFCSYKRPRSVSLVAQREVATYELLSPFSEASKSLGLVLEGSVKVSLNRQENENLIEITCFDRSGFYLRINCEYDPFNFSNGFVIRTQDEREGTWDGMSIRNGCTGCPVCAVSHSEHMSLDEENAQLAYKLCLAIAEQELEVRSRLYHGNGTETGENFYYGKKYIASLEAILKKRLDEGGFSLSISPATKK